MDEQHDPAGYDASAPGSVSSQGPRSPVRVGDGEAERWQREAERLEQARALRGAFAVGVLGLALLALGALPQGRAQIFRDNGLEGPGPWAGSLATLVLLLVALQIVLVLLAVEHQVTRAGVRATRTLWVLRLLVLLFVLLAVLVGRVSERLWEQPGWVALAAQLGALAYTVRVDRQLDHPLRAATRTESAYLGVAAPAPARALEESDALVAIGASGGGIRAAAFVLGGHQAVQACADDLQVSEPQQEPHVFAVSGGSYVACAMALRRTYDEDGQTRPDHDAGRAWRTAYAMDSPELERLRRHTRYLYEPAGLAADGLVALVTGALVNLAIVAMVIRVLAWLSVQLGVTVTFVSTLKRDVCGQLPGLGLACGWGVPEWLAMLSPSLLAVAAVVGLTWKGWTATGAFDDDNGPQARTDREEATRWLTRVETWRPLLLTVAAAWVVLAVGVPAASVGVARMVTSNGPTPAVAGVLHAAGFATTQMCQEAFQTNVGRAATRVENEARISPGARRTVAAGACGVETTVSRMLDTKGTESTDDDVVVKADGKAAKDLIEQANLAGPAAAVGVLLTGVLALLRRGPAPETTATASRWTRAKRVLLTWLPLLITATIGLYALLVWSFGLIVNMSISYRGYAAVFTVVGFAVAFLVDANATSMHGFYRSRLASAFAVTVDRWGVADHLPTKEVYRFSDMSSGADGPRLHVVSTLNSQAPHEAPTMRGGFPLVFGPERVELFRERRTRISVPTADYESYAGPGRVSVMAAMAISGAAISPLMGRFAVQMTPYRLLLALFNLRVGSWVRNPMHTGAAAPASSGWDSWMWMTRHPGLFNVVAEGVGRTSADERWVYLSDGGHLDNTGLVECVRHCVLTGHGGRVLVVDASNDPVGSWGAVGDAVAVIRSDLDIDLRRTQLGDDPRGPLPPWARRYTAAGLDVLVVKAVRTPHDDPDPALRRWWDQLPPNVQSFQQVHADFPRSSTARQKFGDLEFEAYRGLGFVSVSTAVRAAGWVGQVP